MNLYNTVSRKKEKFIPISEGELRMYVCGPTVYDFIHIGNARPMIVFDTFRRYMEHRGYRVIYVSNFTDVDDKIIRRAKEEGVSAEEIASRFIEECKKDMEGMNVLPATVHPLATEEIDGMISMISSLIEKGCAYRAPDGTVYYRTHSFSEYGKLSHKNLDELESGHREILSGDGHKENPYDFVLWKPKKEGEPCWQSPWSEGRPGWHIECSVMAKKYLGDEIDIHAGGEDLIFPHHENEIAQSEAANGKPFARYWLHNAFLNINEKKMSKSEGNFFTVREIAGEYDLKVLRFLILSAHYRTPLNFSRELMDSAKSSLERIETAGEMLKRFLACADAASDTVTEEEREFLLCAEGFGEKFDASMEDDINTADAISAVFEYVRFCNTHAGAENTEAYLSALYERLNEMCDILGLSIEAKGDEAADEIEALIEERAVARKNKDFEEADRIRERLAGMGIEIKDTREGTVWKRI